MRAPRTAAINEKRRPPRRPGGGPARRESDFLPVAMAAHDLRNALQSAQGAHDFLDFVVTDPDAREAIQILGAALHRMTYLVGTLNSRTISSRPARSCAQAADLGCALAAASSSHTGVVVDVSAGLRTTCAAEDLDRIAANLLTNAMAYGAPPIEVRARPRGGFIEFTVTDHGPGIDPGYASTLFEPYTRGQTRPQPPGSGLGLAIVRELCAANGGQVTCEPHRPHGARFRVRLPSAS